VRRSACRQARRDTRKVVTALFCDVTGWTALSEKADPEILRRVMDRCFAADHDLTPCRGDHFADTRGARRAELPLVGASVSRVGVRSLVEVAYQHILVAYDGTSEGDAALLAASELATRDGGRLTIVTVVALERPIRRVARVPMPTGVWNDVLLDRARCDLERADRLLDMPAERTVLFGSQTKALAAGAEEFGCDAIMLPAPRSGRLVQLLHLDRSRRLQRRAAVPVLRPG
jgi:nucleotide-binding universal stress UspA family protein